MKSKLALALLPAALMSLSSPPATAAGISALPPHHGPIFWPHPIHIPNPHNYRVLDAKHDVVTSLSNWTPNPLPSNVQCAALYDPGQFCYATDWSPFSVDLGGGVDLASVLSVNTAAVDSNAIADLLFDNAAPAGSPYLHLTGFLDTPNDDTVTATVELQVSGKSSVTNNVLTYQNTTLPYGALVLALQTQDSFDRWNDAAVAYNLPLALHGNDRPGLALTVSGKIPAGTAVRAELRVGSPTLSPYTDGVSIQYGAILVPECIPDAANPGSCL